MKTFEGYILIKEFKNHNGDKRPLTIDVENEKELQPKINKIKKDFLNISEEGKELPFSVKIELTERK
jgi:hypothetical protein